MQKSLVIAGEYIAIASMKKAKLELCDLHNVSREQTVEVVASYDGAYQQRGGKSGGVHSRYASTISVETGKVLSYGIACHSCRNCSMYDNLLRNDRISVEDYKKWEEKHSNICQATFYVTG